MKKTGFTDFEIEIMARGEIPRDRTKADISKAKRRIDALRASEAEIHAAYPTDAMRKAVLRRLADGRGAPSVPQRSRSRFTAVLAWTAPSLALAAALALTIGLALRVQPKSHAGAERDSESMPLSSPSSFDTTRSKGLSSHLVVYRRTATGVEALQSGVRLAAGETLQLAFVRERKDRYAVIASVDGRGTVTWHEPETPGSLHRIPSGTGEILLEKAYQLDDAPEFEIFCLLTSERAFDPALVSTTLAALVRPEGRVTPTLPNDVSVHLFKVLK